MSDSLSTNTLNQWVGNYNQTTYSSWLQLPSLSIILATHFWEKN